MQCYIKLSYYSLQEFSSGGRQNARKILVVITDKRSTSKLMDLTSEGLDLEEQDIRVIPVALGNEADSNELQKITPWLDDILEIDKDDNPYEVAEIILKIGLKGNWKSYLNCSHMVKVTYLLIRVGRL